MNSNRHPRRDREAALPGSIPPKLEKPKKRGSKFVLLVVLGLVLIPVYVWYSRDSVDQGWGPPAQGDRPEMPQGRMPVEPETGRSQTRMPAPKPAPEKVTGPRAAPPTFSRGGGIYPDQIQVELASPVPSATIRYTLDGSEPSTVSRAYTGPVAIDGTTFLKAKAFEPGLAPSVTVSRTYTMLDSGLKEFTSNLPLVVINSFGQQITKPETVTVSVTIIGEEGKRTALTGPSAFEGRCEIKLRGYSSLRLPKRSFSLKTRNDSGEPLETPLLGLPADSDWVLYAPYSDKTMMRDVLAYELSNKMGRYAARTRFVEVFLNRQGDALTKRDYLGVYVLEEKIKRAPHRVNIQKLGSEDNSEPNITGGYIFKRDHTSPPMDTPFAFNAALEDGRGFSTSRGLHLFYVEPKEEELTSAQKSWLSRYVRQFEKALYGPSFADPEEGYARYLDVASFIDQFWIVELSKNVDGFRYSCYMIKDRGGKIRMEPIWDWNLSFGNANYHQGWMPEHWYWRLLRENEISWIRRLSQDPEFMQRLADRWTELRNSLFAPENLLQRVDELADQLQEAQARNFQRWPILGRSVNPNFFVGDSFEEEVNWMKDWIRQRIAWIDSQFLAPPRLSSKRTNSIEIEAPDGSVFFTLDGSDPRLPGGSISPKAREYGEPIVLPANGRIVARARNGDNWSGPIVHPAGSVLPPRP